MLRSVSRALSEIGSNPHEREVALYGQSVPVLPRRRGCDLRPHRSILHQCWRALQEVSEAKWLPSGAAVQIGFKRGSE